MIRFALILSVIAASSSCSTEKDCNYNGKCASQTSGCTCTPQWRGAACDELSLLPASHSDPLGYRGHHTKGGRVTSWGGSVIIGDDGEYHMYAAQIEGNCGMNVWLSNSRVIHATSPDPATTPFTFSDSPSDVVAPRFAHEPIAVRAPTGEYVVYYTAVLPPGKLPVNGPHGVGQFCTGCVDGNSQSSCGTDSNRNATINLPTYMVYSHSPGGPWSTPVMIPGTDVFADSNFAPAIRKDGSLVALARHNIYNATDWKRPSTYTVIGTWNDKGEDPFVWVDAHGVLHNIVHVRRPQTYGLHYYSDDNGATWTAATGHAYEWTLNFTDGSSVAYGCRERPHIVQNKALDIIGLTNGAAEKTCHSSSKPVVDYSYTLFQAVAQKSTKT